MLDRELAVKAAPRPRTPPASRRTRTKTIMTEHLNSPLLIDYLRRELPPEDDALVLAHLEKCSACRREYEVEVSLSDALRAAAAREELEFPSMIAARVWEIGRAS